MTTLDEINRAPAGRFAALLDGVYGGAPWVAEGAHAARPAAGWPTSAALKRALVEAVRGATREAQLALLRAQPASTDPADATAEVAATLQRLGADYEARFGFPFLLALQGPRGDGLAPAAIVSTLERRSRHHPDFEFAEALRSLHRIAELRLDARLGVVPRRGRQVWDWAEALAVHSDPGFVEQRRLTVTYLTPAHQAVAAQLQRWMGECGFDDVARDAVGNVVGVYRGRDPDAPRLLTGSHYDTVRNGGKYDGRLGILVPMAVVAGLHAVGRRLRHGIEVVGFAEEEGQRYKATFLGSGALTGSFEPAWLDQADADGITMRQAMQAAGLPGTMDAIRPLARDPARYVGFVEVHIEQGPVLDALDLPLGVVTSINGSVRCLGEVIGQASHAGTTPMGQRRDAACAVAELALYVEQRAAAVPDVVGTVGILEVPAGSLNVVPGRCRFSLDLRATTDAARDALAADVRAELTRICEARGLGFVLEETLRAAAAPSAPAWQARWEAAVAALGLPLHRLPSGAGHDAMKLHERLPQAMLFVRGGNAGISHNPLETITADDAELCVAAFEHLLLNL